ncbi:hypothetical protein Esti_001374 [Eimeria stiedai]
MGATPYSSIAAPMSGTLRGVMGWAHDYSSHLNETAFTGLVAYAPGPGSRVSLLALKDLAKLREFELLTEELESTRRRLNDKVKETEELRTRLEQNSRELIGKQAAHEGLRGQNLEKDALVSQLRAELLEARANASSRDTLMQQKQTLSQRIEALFKENLSLVKHKRKLQSLEVDMESAKTVIEVLKVQIGTNKTLKTFNSPVSTGLGAPPVGSTPSTLSGRKPSATPRAQKMPGNVP